MPLVHEDELIVWTDKHIRVGSDWRREILHNLNSATAVVLVVSANCLASKFITKVELPAALVAAQERNIAIFQLIVGPSMVAANPHLAKLQAVNDPARPLSSLPKAKQEEALLHLAEEVAKALGLAAR